MTKKRYISASLKQVFITLFCLMMALPMLAQNRTVRGTVVDDIGDPVIGATVRVEGATRGTATDFDGNFSIEAAANETLRISYIGFDDVLMSASQATLMIVLREDATQLQELVVMGFNTMRDRNTLTAAVAVATGDEIRTTRNENVVNMIAGRMPGVRVQQTSAQPGAFDTNIDIRGMGTPLIVVDGIPRDQGYLARMDASEIESMSVLKDASAAIYGVQAANGVLLVTTRRGTGNADGKFDIQFSTNFGFQSFLYTPNTVDAVTHMLIVNEKNLNTNFGANWFGVAGPRYSWDEIFQYSSGRRQSTNWTDEMFSKVSPQSQHNLTVNGSSNRIDYFFNLGYMEQVGAYRSGSMWYDRYNFRSNVDARITDRLTASVDISGYMDNRHEPHATIWSVYKDAWTFRPQIPAWVDGNRNSGLPYWGAESDSDNNPVADTDHRISGYRLWNNTHFSGRVALRYNIPGVEGLVARAMYNYTRTNSNTTNRQRTYNLFERRPDGELNQFMRNTPGSLRREMGYSYNTNMQLQLSYDRVFGEHSVSGMMALEEQYNYWDGIYAQRQMFFDADYLFAGADENQLGGGGGVGDNARRALIGRGGYQYLGRYILDYSFRYDGSSRFPAASRWGFFQSFSAGWRFSEEHFIQDLVPFLSNGMLRASIGWLGDDGGAGNYPATLVGYSLTDGNAGNRGWMFGGTYMGGVNPLAIPNPLLTWYTSETQNIGIDLNFWNHKLTFTADAFRRTRDGLLRTPDVVLPMEVGASMPQQNLDSDRTFGWEISFGHRNRWNGIEYWANAQLSATKNRWVRRLDSPAGNSMENWRRQDVSGRNRDIWWNIAEGGRWNSIDDIRNHMTPGVQQGAGLSTGSLPGDYWYVDWDGDGFITENDRHPMATFGLPVFNYGITGGASWKGIDFAMLWQGAQGVYTDFEDAVFTEVAPYGGQSVLDWYTDRWHTANIGDNPWHPNTQWIPGYYPATGRPFNSNGTRIRDMSYLRLKSLEIGYQLPRPWLQPLGVQSLRVHVSGYNLLTFTKVQNFDPERVGRNSDNDASVNDQFRHPVNRVLNVGATISF
ncbi:MAG: TonB-dependent receptor [Dysgonamonadaceae bacterium]|jgi:TonB-linked SusC/RagA family outer membrane protein|nr:TonB-dependent receptor [Dysgonamonadaceae bacterium]